jgi:hypothetical protein
LPDASVFHCDFRPFAVQYLTVTLSDLFHQGYSVLRANYRRIFPLTTQ